MQPVVAGLPWACQALPHGSDLTALATAVQGATRSFRAADDLPRVAAEPIAARLLTFGNCTEGRTDGDFFVLRGARAGTLLSTLEDDSQLLGKHNVKLRILFGLGLRSTVSFYLTTSEIARRAQNPSFTPAPSEGLAPNRAPGCIVISSSVASRPLFGKHQGHASWCSSRRQPLHEPTFLEVGRAHTSIVP